MGQNRGFCTVRSNPSQESNETSVVYFMVYLDFIAVIEAPLLSAKSKALWVLFYVSMLFGIMC